MKLRSFVGCLLVWLERDVWLALETQMRPMALPLYKFGRHRGQLDLGRARLDSGPATEFGRRRQHRVPVNLSQMPPRRRT
ncbi:hypothetical protein BKA80DRAFT_264253 [Phyllosticta citrichinensis]